MSLRIWLPLNGNLENIGISGNIYTTSLTSGNTWVSGGKIANQALQLTKSQQLLPANNTSCMYGAKEISWAFWVKVNTAWDTQWLDGIRWTTTDGSSTATCRQEFYTNCTLIGMWFRGGSIAGKSFTPGVWTHLAGTLNYNTGETNFYINGVLVGSTTNATTTHYCRGDFYIGDSGVNILENDVRIYDHCLSAKEVKEIAQGLVLHYKLDGLEQSSDNFITGILAGGQTTVNNLIVTTSGENKDTYFKLQLKQPLVEGKAYKISCIGENIPNNSYWCFPVGSQSNTSLPFNIYEGYNEYTFIANSSCTSNPLMMDDLGRTNVYMNQCVFKNFQLYECDKITDSSGYGHDGIATGALTTASESGRYNSATYIPMGSTDYIITQDAIGNPADAITMNIWFKSSNLTPGNNYHEVFNHATNTQNFEFAIHKDGYFRGGMVINGTRYVNNTPQLGLLDGNWHMLSMTYDGHTIIRYVDGISRSTTSIAGEITGANAKFLWGHYGPNTSYYAKEAYLSDARIYATALSADDILDLYHTPANIDNLGGLHGFEMVEDSPKQAITQNGQIMNQGSTKTYLVNNFTETGTTTDWTFGGTTHIANGIVTLEGVNPNIVSSWFTVNPEDIIVFEGEIWLPTPSTSSGSAGLYLGTPGGASYATTTYLYHWTTNTWSTSNTNNTNPYFIYSYNLTNRYQFKTYILGSDMTIDDIPMAQTNNTARELYAIKLNSTTTSRIRSGYNTNTSMQICLYNFKIYNIHDDGFCELKNDAKIGQGYYRFSNFIEK